MVNIVFVGYSMSIASTILEEAVREVILEYDFAQECQLTINPSHTKNLVDGNPAPYVTVQGDDLRKLKKVAQDLNKKFGLAVLSSLVIYLEGNPGSLWNQEGR